MSDKSSSYPKVNEVIPNFTAVAIGGDFGTETEKHIKFYDLFAGQDKVLLYFYPKDDTPGCTTQACDIRDRWDELSEIVKVIGVSKDSVKSHVKFIKKFSLPFPLLSDEDNKISELFGVWREKNMFGKKYFGIERSSFLIDENKKLLGVLPNVKPNEHVDKILALLK